MMKINSASGSISFSCIICSNDLCPCLDCLKERNIFDTAFRSAEKNAPSNIENYTGYDREIYHHGYEKGSRLALEF